MFQRQFSSVGRKSWARKCGTYAGCAILAFLLGVSAYMLWPLHISHSFGVNLLTLGYEKDNAVLAIENNTVKRIYISICTCCQAGTHHNSQPVVYALVHKAPNGADYEFTGPNFHSCLELRSVGPGERVQFESYLRSEEGTYQARVSYLEDPEVAQMIKSLSDMNNPKVTLTDAEHEKIMKSWKEVKSDVPPGESRPD